MSEWVTFLAVFWILWAADGVRLPPHRVFGFAGGWRIWRAWFRFDRWQWPSPWPWSWRAMTADVPFSLSPLGLTNRPAGSAGRPAESPARAGAIAWEAVRDIRAADGWLLVNGARFCRDTGHATAAELRALVPLAPAAREIRIRAMMRRWMRPLRLRRRVRVLTGRTLLVTTLNTVLLVLAVLVTIHLAGDFAGKLPKVWAERIARALPYWVGYALILHFTAVILAWRASRRLKAVVADKRGAALFSALLLPPQALRLRALAGEGWFSAQHPLAYALAFAGERDRDQLVFQTLADLRWPTGDQNDPPQAREIAAWFRAALTRQLDALLDEHGVEAGPLFAAPAADGPESCSYCPRCRDQFVAGPTECPHGVPLKPVAKKSDR